MTQRSREISSSASTGSRDDFRSAAMVRCVIKDSYLSHKGLLWLSLNSPAISKPENFINK